MTTPIPITAHKKELSINANEQKRSKEPLKVTTTYNLLGGAYQLTATSYNLVVGAISHEGFALEIIAPKKNYHIIAPERN